MMLMVKSMKRKLWSNSKHFGAKILKCGIIIHAQKLLLCVSPDNIKTEQNQNLKSLEIK